VSDASDPASDSTVTRIHRGLYGGDIAAMLVGWLLLVGLGIVLAQRIAVTGPAGMSFPRSSLFILNAASLSGFEMTWTSPGVMTPVHAALWVFFVAFSALLSLVIATAAMARVAGADWSWTRICTTAIVFLAGVWLVAFVAELAGGNAGLRTSAWNALAVGTGNGLTSENGSDGPRLLWLARFPLSFLAAIGPFVLLDTLRGQSLSAHSRATWLAWPIAFLLTVGLVTAVQWLAGDGLLAAATVAIDSHGTGFTDDLAAISPAARWALVPVLLLGGPGGGIAGGLKAVTLLVLAAGIFRLMRRGAGAGRTFAIAAAWLVGLAVLFFVTFILLLHTSPQLRPDRAALVAAAACGNTGISVDPLSMAGDDAYVLAAAMLLGRALPWIVLGWSAARGDEPVAVG
jgi:hypothetical protein